MIIGLSGYAGVGKDTLAKYIVELDPSFEIKKFSGKLKEVASLLTGIPVDNFENQKFKTQELNGWDMTVSEEGIHPCILMQSVTYGFRSQFL